MCNCNNNNIYIHKIVNTGETIELVPNRDIKLENLGDMCYYNLILGCGLQCTESLPLIIGIADAKIPVLDKFGNTVYFNQIKRTRYRWCFSYGNRNELYTVGQFVVHNPLCLPSFVGTSNPFKTVTNKMAIKGDTTK